VSGRFVIPLQLALMALSTTALPGAAQQPSPTDPFVWLEDVDGKRALDWVHAKNAATEAVLSKTSLYQPIYDRTMQILDSKDRIAMPRIIGDRIYNFWQDAEHKRGIWRRTSFAEYVAGRPVWETVIDVDALSKAENTTFSIGEINCFSPADRLCLVGLSRGGSDAAEIRELDLATGRFVANGFRVPAAKSSVAWVDENTLLIGTDFGPGSMTTSGYPRVIKRWTRGTPLSSAVTVLEVDAGHVLASASSYDAGGRRYVRVADAKTFYTTDEYLYVDGALKRIEVPHDADVHLVRDQLIVYVRDPWTVNGTVWRTGSLVAMSVDDFMRGQRDLRLVFEPGATETVDGVSATRDHLLVSLLNSVRGELRRYTHANGEWRFEKVPAPDMGSVSVTATTTSSNRFFFTYTSFIQPTTLYLSDDAGAIAEVKRMPAMFDAKGLAVQQLHATSKDGTKVPFFVVHRDGLPRDGRNPTLMYAYGGFEVSNTPSYGGTVGAAWLERGGVYVLANIRGGGEFGPRWHRAGLKENRQRVYDDFAAVAEELVRQKITSPTQLGIMGGSNGGLLVGVAFTQRPDLYGAVAVQVPLLDMQRYNHLLAGASWMAEYGDPDKPEEWAYISKYSPYHNLKADATYPTVLFTTTTRDDRVHPGHARKMAAKMEAMGKPFHYFENTEGGHGTGVTNEQRAKTLALTYAYLWKQLGAALVP
jgi:prolyl oligopeptidase